MLKNFLDPIVLNSTLTFILIGAFLILFFSFVSFKNRVPFKKKPSNINMIGYKLIYTDQKESHKQRNVDYNLLLYSSRYDIQGKPDYIFKNILNGRLVPVEIKSGSIKDSASPHPGDLMQLAAYFLIIQDVYHQKPKYGKLIYKDYMFQIRNTAKIRKEVQKTLFRMRSMLKTGEETAHPDFVTCRYCVCRDTVCEHYKKPKPKTKTRKG